MGIRRRSVQISTPLDESRGASIELSGASQLRSRTFFSLMKHTCNFKFFACYRRHIGEATRGREGAAASCEEQCSVTQRSRGKARISTALCSLARYDAACSPLKAWQLHDRKAYELSAWARGGKEGAGADFPRRGTCWMAEV